MNKLEFLQDTINYYWGKPERRCYDEKLSQCFYGPIGESQGCAIGRHISPELQGELDEKHGGTNLNMEMFEKLPDWMQKLGLQYLRAVQSLHDSSHLADKHLSTIEDFCQNHKLDFKKLVFPE